MQGPDDQQRRAKDQRPAHQHQHCACATGDSNIHTDSARIGSSTAFSTVLTALSMSGTSNAPMVPAEVEALLNKIRVRSPRPGA